MKGFVFALVFSFLALISCGVKGETQEKVVRVAVILPVKGKWEYREYENGREVGKSFLDYYLFSQTRKEKGHIYSSMARDRMEEASRCGNVISKLVGRVKGKILKVEVVSRKDVDKVLQEQKFQASGLVDSNTVAQIGKLLGADYLVIVEPRYIAFKRDFYTEERKIGVPVVYEKGIFKCVAFRASTRINVSVVSVFSAKVLLTKLYSGSAGPERQCSRQGFRTDELPTYDDVIDSAIEDASSKFSKDFCSLEL